MFIQNVPTPLAEVTALAGATSQLFTIDVTNAKQGAKLRLSTRGFPVGTKLKNFKSDTTSVDVLMADGVYASGCDESKMENSASRWVSPIVLPVTGQTLSFVAEFPALAANTDLEVIGRWSV